MINYFLKIGPVKFKVQIVTHILSVYNYLLWNRDQDALNSEKFTYKWHQSLRDLDLTTSAITPNMQTTVNVGNTSSTILSPKTGKCERIFKDE